MLKQTRILLLGVTVGLFGVFLVAQDYDSDLDTEEYNEEWYDPTDWFDDDFENDPYYTENNEANLEDDLEWNEPFENDEVFVAWEYGDDNENFWEEESWENDDFWEDEV